MADEEVRVIFAAEDRYSATADAVVASMQNVAEKAAEVAAATGQITVASEAVAGAGNWEDLEKKLLAVTGGSEQAAQAVEGIGAATAASAIEGAAAVEGLIEADAQAAQAAEAVGTATADGAAKGATAVEGLTGQVQGLQKALQTAMQIGGAAFAFEGVQRAGEKYLAYGEAGAGLINLERGFYNVAEQAGLSGDAMYEAMMRAGQGIADDDDLMREFVLTTRAAGGAMQEFPALIQTAMSMAEEGTGTTLSNLQAIDQYIRTGMARGLKREGLIVPDDSVVMATYAAGLGKTADQLTELEQSQARVNAVLEVARGKYDLTEAGANLAGAEIAKLKVTLDNLGEAAQVAAAPGIDRLAGSLNALTVAAVPAITKMGELYTWQQKIAGAPMPEGMPGGDFLGGAQGMLDKLVLASSPLASVFRLLSAGSREAGTAIGTQLTPALDDMFASVDRLPQPLEEMARLLGVLRYEAEEFGGGGGEGGGSGITDIGDSAAAAAPETRTLNLALYDLALTSARLPRIWHDLDRQSEDLTQEMARARKASGEVGLAFDGAQKLARLAAMGFNVAEDALAGYTAQAEQAVRVLGALNAVRAYGAGGMPGEEGGLFAPMAWGDIGLGGGMGGLVAQGQDVLGALNEDRAFGFGAVIRAAGGAADAISEAERAMNSYLNTYSQAVGTILSPTQGVDIAGLQDKLGMHEDTWDENARRAMDVVNRGAESEWSAKMGLETPQEALGYMEQFYAGKLNADQYNMGAAADAFRQQMEGMVGAERLQGMLGDALSGAGLGPDSTLVADALGPQGAPAAEAFATAFAAHDWPKLGTSTGAAFIGAFGTALKQPGTAFTTTVRQVCESIFQDWLNRNGMP